MNEHADVDPADLRADVENIKDAMGIGERYPGWGAPWLVFAAFVALAAAVSQYAVLEELSTLVYPAIWFVAMGAAGVVAGYVAPEPGQERTPDAAPNLPLQFGAVFAAYLPLVAVVGPHIPEGYRGGVAVVLGLTLVLLAIAYAVLGSSLAAYRVRRRDRLPFYAGAVWIGALGAAVPNVAALETWGFAAFGVAYVVYAAGAYAWLR
jgi:hypothetical protein